NAAVVGTREEIVMTTYALGEVRFVADAPPATEFATTVVLRYRGTPLAARVVVHGDEAILTLDRPALVAPGQAAAFYEGDDVTGTGRGDAATSARRIGWHRAAWGFVSLMALVGMSWFWDLPRQKSFDWTPYHNDAIALNECAARLLVDGRDPYRDLDLFACY